MSTITQRSEPTALGSNGRQTPPLENGDRLKAAEFERRYEMMPNVKKAELIRGVVYMPSPVRAEHHGEPHADLMGWIAIYRFSTRNVRSADNATMKLDDDNQPQPDACLFIDPARGGQAKVIDGYLTGSPELAAEVASSSVSYDMNQKKEVYAEFGVREYVVWRVLDREIDWWKLRDGAFEPLPIDSEGIIRSETFPGLWLAVEAMLSGNMLEVQAVLNRGLADASHSEFAARLRGPK